MKDDFVTALDLGTNKTCILLGRKGEGSKCEIIGLGCVPISGLKKGVVIDLKMTITAIEKAVNRAERQTNLTIHSLFVNIGGSHIKGMNCHGAVEISNKNQEILKEDVEGSIRAAKATCISTDREIITAIPQEYIVDSEKEIKEPEGMIGKKLETKIFFISAKKNSIQNMERCISESGFGLEDIYSGALASSEAVLTQSEKEIGVFFLDIGAGTTDIIIYLEGKVKEINVLPVGGDHITNDLAIGLRAPISESERLKKDYGCCLESLITDHKLEIPIRDSTGRSFKIGLTSLAEIIEPRMEEIFLLAKRTLDRSDCNSLIGAGIVITGGTSLLKGAEELGEKIFKMPVRIGKPRNVIGFEKNIHNPIFSTAVGLLQHGLKRRETTKYISRFSQNNPLVRFYKKIRRTFNDFF